MDEEKRFWAAIETLRLFLGDRAGAPLPSVKPYLYTTLADNKQDVTAMLVIASGVGKDRAHAVETLLDNLRGGSNGQKEIEEGASEDGAQQP